MAQSRIALKSLIFAAALLSLSCTGWAQVSTVDLTVRVSDPQNATVPGALVSVKNLETAAER